MYGSSTGRATIQVSKIIVFNLKLYIPCMIKILFTYIPLGTYIPTNFISAYSAIVSRSTVAMKPRYLF
jgi:hypothetical protein